MESKETDLSSMESKETEMDTKRNSFTAMEELAWFAGVVTCVKLLLIPSYRSTDFEVHRNWLALTFSLPFSQWYSDETSPWTLDYPPLFAYFERFLSIFANLVDPKILDLHGGLNYCADSVVYFQRISVIVSDLCLFYGVYRLTRSLDSMKRRLVWVLIVWSPALIIVDHMHFQYNGFLLGFLLISLSFLEEGRDLLGGFYFAVLLCFKHLFAVAAPVYFVYLLRHYCRGGLVRAFGRFLMMGAVVGFVFMVSYGPFLYHGQVTLYLSHSYTHINYFNFFLIGLFLSCFLLRTFQIGSLLLSLPLINYFNFALNWIVSFLFLTKNNSN